MAVTKPSRTELVSEWSFVSSTWHTIMADRKREAIRDDFETGGEQEKHGRNAIGMEGEAKTSIRARNLRDGDVM